MNWFENVLDFDGFLWRRIELRCSKHHAYHFENNSSLRKTKMQKSNIIEKKVNSECVNTTTRT